MKIIVYYRRRASGRKAYGLDLAMQRANVEKWLASNAPGCTEIEQVTETEGEGHADRPTLAKVKASIRPGDLLLIASDYRMRVNVKFLLSLDGVNFAVADNEQLSSKTLPAYLNMARDWAGNLSKLVHQKIKGKVCGAARPGHWNKKNRPLMQAAVEKASKASAQARRDRVLEAYGPIIPIMQRLRQDKEPYHKIADQLNEDGYLTTAGMSFTASAVHRILKDFG